MGWCVSGAYGAAPVVFIGSIYSVVPRFRIIVGEYRRKKIQVVFDSNIFLDTLIHSVIDIKSMVAMYLSRSILQ